MNYFKVENHQLSYLDEGAGEAIVIVHGTPTNSSEYREVIVKLSNDFRCIAIDHLGFGNSDKPDDADYSVQAHQKRLLALLCHLKIKSFHIVVHDFGGVIGLPLVLDSSFEIKTVTILNSWIWPLIETEPQMKNQKWLVTLKILPFFYRHFNFSAKFLIKLGWGKRRLLSIERHRYYVEQFPSRTYRAGPTGFLKALFDFSNPCWSQSVEISKLLVMPVQIIWGKSDKLVSPRNLERWKKLLSKAEVYELEDVGHFVAEEAADEVATRIIKLLGKVS